MTPHENGETTYAYWSSPDGSFRVVYSLPVFFEIDQLVNDGYRLIPRGGVETAGLLFGKRNKQQLTIEQFRTIECEHALGPSFNLSHTDQDALRAQIKTAGTDADLAGLELLGWYIGHTRNALVLSATEKLWFEEFFGVAPKVTVLVKPEHFQATRFGFVLAGAGVSSTDDAAEGAIILPLPRRAASGSEPIPSIPAPKEQAPVARKPDPEESLAPSPKAAPEKTVETPVSDARTPKPNVVLSPRERVGSSAPPRPRQPATGPLNGSMRFGIVLFVAALLGCGAGYWAYLQLPSPVIAVSVRESGPQLVIDWPPAATSSDRSAAIRINDGTAVPLSAPERQKGQTVITPPPGDVKIEIVVSHWFRDSRGIVRYLRASTPAS